MTMKTKRASGRPRVLAIGDRRTHGLIRRSAGFFMTQHEVAAVLNVSLSSFNRYLRDDAEAASAWEEGLALAHLELRKIQWRHAQRSTAMVIFLGKQVLGQSDHVEQHVAVRRIDEMSEAELEQLIRAPPVRVNH